uniref:Uncharacterized protein n=1 Tax=Acrobeloides nanus TaxID=290746 RepID=A0A914E426_9BILA
MVAKLMCIKYCFFHSIYLCPQLKYKHYAELYNYFDQYNQCLHTHHIVYCLYPNERVSLLTKIRDFHEKFVQTTQLGINFDQKEQKTLLAKDGIFEALKYSLATEEIILDIYYTSNTENFIKFVGSEKLFQARRFSIEIEEDATDRRFENFCEQFIEMYKNCSNPSNIVRQTTIQTSLPNSSLYEEFENFVTSKSYIIRPSLAYSLVRVYQFFRQDRWCLEVSIYCNFKTPQRVKLEASKIRFKILDPEEYKVENKQEEKNQK